MLLLLLPPLAATIDSQALRLFDAFYRAGALVFGGGHVVLPLLQAAVVPPGWVTNDAFLAGYGAAQAMPGPLFTFAAYLGAVMIPPPNGALGALIAMVAIFAPSFLLVIGLLPFWDTLRQRQAHAGDAARRERRGGRRAARGALYACMDGRRAHAGRLRPRRSRAFLALDALGDAAMDRRDCRRVGRVRPGRARRSRYDQPGIFGKLCNPPPSSTQGCALSQ